MVANRSSGANRLRDVAIHACGEVAFAIALHGIRRHRDDHLVAAVLRFLLAGSGASPRSRPSPASGYPSGPDRTFLGQGGERLLAVAGDPHPVPLRSSNITARRWLIRLSSTSRMESERVGGGAGVLGGERRHPRRRRGEG